MALDEPPSSQIPLTLPMADFQVPRVRLLLFCITGAMKMACKLNRSRWDTKLTKVEVRSSQPNPLFHWVGVKAASTAAHSDSSSSLPHQISPLSPVLHMATQYWPCAVCRSPCRRRVGCLPPFVYLSDECLLTWLNKGIISRLHRRGWTAWKEGNRALGPLDSQLLHKSLNHRVRDKSE